MPTYDRLDLSIVTYNSQRWIESFLDSLLNQSYPCTQISLLWRDNGSNDGTVALLGQWRERHGERFARFEIDAGANIGFGQGHNANLRGIDSDYFLVTNVDIRFERDTLTTLLFTAQADPADIAAWECRQKPYEHPKLYHPATGETEWCSSACVLFRTAAFRAVRGYEPRLFLYGEDVELSYRLRASGYRLRYVPRATVWHYTYAEAAELKPAQFLGSTLANVLLRCRFGTWGEAVAGFLMYPGLFFVSARFPRQRWKLLANAGKLLYLAPYFLATRHTGGQTFGFRLWDYSVSRAGAFHAHAEEQPEETECEFPLVSVLIRTMPGRDGKLREAIASVVAQTYPAIELVIVEDGGDTAAGLAESLRGNGRFVAVVYRPLDKMGRCRAGNAALANAGGKLLCFLDDDDLLFADHLEVLVAAWRREPSLGAVYALAFQVRTEVISEEPWEYRDIEHNLIYRQPFSRAILWHHNYLPIQTVLFRRDLYEKWGGFDVELDNLEDWNLWVRYSLHDDFRMVEKLTSLYRVPAISTHAAQRQQTLDEYYAKAQAKHARLRVELNPTQVVAMALELGRELHVAGVPTAWIRARVLGLPGAHILYHSLRRLWHLFRRARS